MSLETIAAKCVKARYDLGFLVGVEANRTCHLLLEVFQKRFHRNTVAHRAGQTSEHTPKNYWLPEIGMYYVWCRTYWQLILLQPIKIELIWSLHKATLMCLAIKKKLRNFNCQVGKSNPSKSCVQPPDPASKEKRQGDKWTQARDHGIFI